MSEHLLVAIIPLDSVAHAYTECLELVLVRSVRREHKLVSDFLNEIELAGEDGSVDCLMSDKVNFPLAILTLLWLEVED